MPSIGTIFRAMFHRQPASNRDMTVSSAAYELDEVRQMANEGRKLAIYDRGTGLYAYWYLQLRADEEILRAARYQKQLSCLSVWATTPDAITRVTAGLKGDLLRGNDLAGYLNNGHFVILLPETPEHGAQIVLDRLRSGLGDLISGVLVSFPTDGKTFDELLECAKAKDASPQASSDTDAA